MRNPVIRGTAIAATVGFAGPSVFQLLLAAGAPFGEAAWGEPTRASCRMLWLGMLFYAMYASLFYAVAAASNRFFLLYVASSPPTSTTRSSPPCGRDGRDVG